MQDYPELTLTNGVLTVSVYLPDAQHGYYRGTRFDWSGILRQAEYRGHTYFGELRPEHDPLGHDHAPGPAEEFNMQNPPGFAEARVGGRFLKIGVGVLKKTEERYRFHHHYPILDHGKRTLSMGFEARSLVMTHEAGLGRRLAYHYTKTIELAPDQPVLRVRHLLRNTGREPLAIEHYSHNIFRLDDQSIGSCYELEYPFSPEMKINTRDKEAVQLEGNRLTFRDPRLTATVHINFSGFGPDTPNRFTLTNRTTKSALEVSIDMPPAKVDLYAEPPAVCPEPFVAFEIQPGQHAQWTHEMTFYGDGRQEAQR